MGNVPSATDTVLFIQSSIAGGGVTSLVIYGSYATGSYPGFVFTLDPGFVLLSL